MLLCGRESVVVVVVAGGSRFGMSAETEERPSNISGEESMLCRSNTRIRLKPHLSSGQSCFLKKSMFRH